MKNHISQNEYSKIVKDKSPPSNLLKDIIIAFTVGGLICVIGQIINNCLKNFDLKEEDAASLTSSVLIFTGAFLTGTGLYARLAKHAGAGTLVPITGFANSIVSPAIEYRTEGLVTGVGAKMFTIAGPVLVYGITASVLYGCVYYISDLMK